MQGAWVQTLGRKLRSYMPHSAMKERKKKLPKCFPEWLYHCTFLPAKRGFLGGASQMTSPTWWTWVWAGSGSWWWMGKPGMLQSSSVQSLSHVRLIATPWTAVRQASLSITNFRSLLKLLSIESVMPSNHLILCHPLLLLPSIFPCIRVFSNESVLYIRWPKYWSFSFSISPYCG